MPFRVFDKLFELFRKEGQDRTLVDILPDHVQDGAQAGPALHGGEGYFRIWISHMLLARERDWFSVRFPSVSAFTTFNFGGSPTPVEIAHIAGPQHLKDVDARHLDNVISVNQLVCATVPFHGGSVEFEAGLLSIEARDEMAHFLNAMGTVASLVAVPQLSAALTIADKVAMGARDFVGVSANRMVLGYQNTFIGENDEPGDSSHNKCVTVTLLSSTPPQATVRMSRSVFGYATAGSSSATARAALKHSPDWIG